MKLLITSPENDLFTRYLRLWTRKLLEKISKNSTISYILLDKNQATRERFEGTVRKMSPNVILLNGHGGDKCVFGQEDKPIVDDKNAKILNNRIVHALSCSSAAKLGPLAVKKGAKAYIGYDSLFFVPTFDEKQNDPLHDGTAKLFLDAAFVAPKALATGKSPKEAVNSTKKAFTKSIAKALMSGIQSDNDQFVSLLKWDRDHLISIEK